MKFTCSDVEMQWIMDLYFIPPHRQIQYISGNIELGSFPEYHRGPFASILTSLRRRSEDLADLASDLILNSSQVESGTTVTCKVYDRDSNLWQKSTMFHHAGESNKCSFVLFNYPIIQTYLVRELMPQSDTEQETHISQQYYS